MSLFEGEQINDVHSFGEPDALAGSSEARRSVIDKLQTFRVTISNQLECSKKRKTDRQ